MNRYDISKEIKEEVRNYLRILKDIEEQVKQIRDESKEMKKEVRNYTCIYFFSFHWDRCFQRKGGYLFHKNIYPFHGVELSKADSTRSIQRVRSGENARDSGKHRWI
jgi:hypothetical protein